MRWKKLLVWVVILLLLVFAAYFVLVRKTTSADVDAATQAALAELDQACFYQTGQTSGKAFTDCLNYYHLH